MFETRRTLKKRIAELEELVRMYNCPPEIKTIRIEYGCGEIVVFRPSAEKNEKQINCPKDRA